MSDIIIFSFCLSDLIDDNSLFDIIYAYFYDNLRSLVRICILFVVFVSDSFSANHVFNNSEDNYGLYYHE